MRRLAAVTDSAWMLLGLVMMTGSQWLVVVVFARLGSAETVGEYTLIAGLATPLFIFGALQLRTVIATDPDHRFTARAYFVARQLGLLVAVGSFCVAVVLLGYGRLWLVAVGIALLRLFDQQSDLVYGLLQRAVVMRPIGISRSLQALGQFAAAAIIFLVSSGNLVVSVLGMGIISAIVFTAYDLNVDIDGARVRRIVGGSSATWRQVTQIGTLALPLGLGASLDAVNLLLPRLFLERSLSIEEVGVFSAVFLLANAQSIVIVAVADAIRPRLAAALNQRSQRARSFVAALVATALLVALVNLGLFALAGGALVIVVYGDEFRDTGSIIVTLALAALPLNLAGAASTVLTAATRYRSVLVSYVSLVVGTFASLIVLVEDQGLTGAAWAVVLGLTARCVVAWTLALPVLRSMSFAPHPEYAVAVRFTEVADRPAQPDNLPSGEKAP